ncbi:MAG: zinc ribbon domain-containing protein [Bacteroidaceae bacterium]|nr:zinc ribbon domain-containing protein [Bacteroidaceae bacterium]
MKYCSNHHANPDDALFCHECGGKLTQTSTPENKKCPKCNAENPSDAGFCHNCGWKLLNFKPQPKPVPAPTPAPEPKPNRDDKFNPFSALLIGIGMLIIGIWTGLDFLMGIGVIGLLVGIVGVLEKIIDFFRQ